MHTCDHQARSPPGHEGAMKTLPSAPILAASQLMKYNTATNYSSTLSAHPVQPHPTVPCDCFVVCVAGWRRGRPRVDQHHPAVPRTRARRHRRGEQVRSDGVREHRERTNPVGRRGDLVKDGSVFDVWCRDRGACIC